MNDCTTTQTDSTLTLMSYDSAQRIQTIRHKQGAALIGQYDYRYDANGNRIEQVLDQGHQIETTTYEYDPNDRLTAVHYPDQSTTYTYDAAYNRLTEHSLKADGSPLLERYYAYDSRNQLLQVEDTTSGLLTAYAYDANGNRIQRSVGTEIQSYQFDIRNQIREIKLGGSSVGQFLYDYQGLRVRKTTPTATTRTVYDDQSVLLQTDADGNTLAKYTYDSDHLFSLTHRSQPPQFYLFDALGSVVALAKLDGALQARYDYDAWGNPRPNAAGESANIFGFTGHEKDDESGLYYFKARFYDPDIGQFLSQDAFEGMADTPPSLHQYLYAYANPTVYVDLDGHCVSGIIVDTLACAAVGALATGAAAWSWSAVYDEVTQGKSASEALGDSKNIKIGLTTTVAAAMIPAIVTAAAPVARAVISDAIATATTRKLIVSETLTEATTATELTSMLAGEAGLSYGVMKNKAIPVVESPQSPSTTGLGLRETTNKPDAIEPDVAAHVNATEANSTADFTTFYHGSSPKNISLIMNSGIDLSKSKPLNDFGDGFYMTTSKTEAIESATMVNAEQALIEFRVPNSELAKLNSLKFGSPNQEWGDFVSMNKQLNVPYLPPREWSAPAFDLVEGPLFRRLGRTGKIQNWTGRANQTSIHNNRAVDLFNQYMVKPE